MALLKQAGPYAPAGGHLLVTELVCWEAATNRRSLRGTSLNSSFSFLEWKRGAWLSAPGPRGAAPSSAHSRCSAEVWQMAEVPCRTLYEAGTRETFRQMHASPGTMHGHCTWTSHLCATPGYHTCAQSSGGQVGCGSREGSGFQPGWGHAG